VFSPDGTLVATGSESGLVVLWKVGRWRPLGQIPAHLTQVTQLDFSPDGAVLATAGEDATVRIWNPSLAQTAQPPKAASVNARTCAAAPDGTWLAVATNAAIVIHNGETTNVREVVNFPDHVYNMAPLGSDLLVAELLNQVLICEVDNWQASRTLDHPAEAMIKNVSLGGKLVCVSDNRQIIVWDIATWKPPMFLEVDASGLRMRDKPLPSQDSLLVRILRRMRPPAMRLRRWPLGRRFSQWLNQRLTRANKRPGALTSQISPDGAWIAVGARNTVQIISTQNWQSIAKLSMDDTITGLLVVPGRQWLAVRCGDRIKYWNSETWLSEEGAIDNRIVESAEDGDWSPDGELLAIVSEDRTLRVHDGATGMRLTELRLDGELSGVAWLSADRLAAVGAHGVYWFSYVSGGEPPALSSTAFGKQQEQQQDL
jgi:WD40 repeat protein